MCVFIVFVCSGSEAKNLQGSSLQPLAGEVHMQRNKHRGFMTGPRSQDEKKGRGSKRKKSSRLLKEEEEELNE